VSERKWLIRKKGPVIELLGPLPKNELKRLIDEKKLSAEDEVCSANGFWFELSETGLVNKYVNGDEPQPFNLISDAPTILAKTVAHQDHHPHGKEISDITLVEMDMKNYYESKSLNKEAADVDQAASAKSASKGSGGPTAFPSQNDLEYPDAPTAPMKKNEKGGFWKRLFSKIS
jgi:hypothetical protein